MARTDAAVECTGNMTLVRACHTPEILVLVCLCVLLGKHVV